MRNSLHGRDIPRLVLEISVLFISFMLPSLFFVPDRLTTYTIDFSGYYLQSLVVAVPHLVLILAVIALQDGSHRIPETLAAFGCGRLRPTSLIVSVGVAAGMIALAGALSFLGRVLPDGIKAGLQWRIVSATEIPIALVFSMVGGYREELFFRAYLLTRLERLGASRLSSVLLSSALFGVGHGYQGVMGILVASGLGAYLSLVFVYRKNAHEVALGHGWYNFLVLISTLVLHP